MSLKAELETWAAALKSYDEQDLSQSLDLFTRIGDNSKMLFNMAIINATMGKHIAAVELFNAATRLDQYLAIAYHQAGVSNFLIGRFDFALKDFDEALLYLRGNQYINYEQLGLDFQLYLAEILFNRGLCAINLGRMEEGLADLADANKEWSIPDHDIINDCIRDRGQGYTVYSIPVGVLYRPANAKLKNVKRKDYMGKAKLIAAADEADAFTTFTGITRLRQGQNPSGSPLDMEMINGLNLRGESHSRTEPALRTQPSFRDRSGSLGQIGSSVPKPTVARSKTTIANMAGIGVNQDRYSPTNSEAGAMRRDVRGGIDSERVGDGLAYMNDNRMRPNAARQNSPSYTTELYDDYYTADAPETLPPIPSISPFKPRDPNAFSPSRSNSSSTSKDYYTSEGAFPPIPPISSFKPRDLNTYPASRSNSSSVSKGSTYAGTPSNMTRSNSAGALPVSFGSTRQPLRRATTKRNGSGGGSSVRSGNGNGNGNGGGVIRITPNQNYEFDGDGEGYLEDDDGFIFEMTKIRLKIHYQGEMRGLSITPNDTYEGFMMKLRTKFKLRGPNDELRAQFQDEEDSMISMLDEDDFEAAVDAARASANGKPEGKLEMWINED